MSWTLLRKANDSRGFTIYADGAADSSQVMSYLAELMKNRPVTHVKLARILDTTANMGPPRNPEQSWPLQGDHAAKLYEFIANEARVLWFYHPNPKVRRVIVCAVAFNKEGNETPRRHIDQAQTIRKQYGG